MDWVFYLLKIVFAALLVTIALVTVAILVWIERKVGAFMQVRLGPNRAGPGGVLQSFADLLKMLRKETTLPKGADKAVYFLAPVVSTFTSLGALVVIPFGPARDQAGYINVFGQSIDWFLADVNVGAVLVLALSSLGVYGLIMAGWGSNSKYSLLGGLRASAQVISYEITLGISLIGVFLLSNSLSLKGIVDAQASWHPDGTPGIWLFLLQPIGLVVFAVSMVAESNRNPFDLPEAESELVGGYHTEYSGIRFGLFYLSEYIAMVIMSSVATVCFLGGWLSPFEWLVRGTDIPFITGLLSGGIHWFVLKLALFLFFYLWLRWTLPRFRYDQLMGLSWKVFLPITLANIMIIGVLRLLVFPPGTTTFEPLYWWLIAAIEIVLFVVLVFALSRTAGRSWFGKAERPVLVERQVILVRNVKAGRGTIEGEARPVASTE